MNLIFVVLVSKNIHVIPLSVEAEEVSGSNNKHLTLPLQGEIHLLDPKGNDVDGKLKQ